MTYLWDFRSQSIEGPGPTPGLGWPECIWKKFISVSNSNYNFRLKGKSWRKGKDNKWNV